MNTRRPQPAAAPVPPAPVGTHDLGTTDETIERMTRWFDEYGDIYRVYSPQRRSWTWVISDPDAIRRVLVGNHRNYTKGVGIDRVRLLLGNGIMTSEGTPWRRQRRMMQPAFQRQVIERFARVIRRECENLAGEWAAAARAGTRVDVTQALSRHTLRVALQAIFSDDLDRLVHDLDDNPFMVVAHERTRDPRFAYQFRQLGQHVLALVRDRCTHPRRRFDFLQMLIDARDPDDAAPMTERELLDEILTLVVAGHETTASALAWTWWLLASHPSVQAGVCSEQDAIGDPGLARYAELGRLSYTRRVIDESMRLYPPGWLLTRRNIGPDRLGGYEVPCGTDIFISPYLVHRHPLHWARPTVFDPEHFTPERVEARHAFAYIPFGGGPRRCIGENFALYEMLLHLNGMARRFRLVEPEPAEATMEARINLRMARNITMRVETR